MYILELLKYFLQWIMCLAIVGGVILLWEKYIVFHNVYIAFAVKTVVVFLISNMLIWLIYGRSEEMKFIYDKLKLNVKSKRNNLK